MSQLRQINQLYIYLFKNQIILYIIVILELAAAVLIK